MPSLKELEDAVDSATTIEEVARVLNSLHHYSSIKDIVTQETMDNLEELKNKLAEFDIKLSFQIDDQRSAYVQSNEDYLIERAELKTGRLYLQSREQQEIKS